NAHLLSDIGGLSLAMAVVLGASAVLMERNLIRAALAGYTVYAASHLLFHATHTGGLPATDAAALLTGLSLLPAFALGLLVLASRAGSAPGRVTPPGREAQAPRPPTEIVARDHGDELVPGVFPGRQASCDTSTGSATSARGYARGRRPGDG